MLEVGHRSSGMGRARARAGTGARASARNKSVMDKIVATSDEWLTGLG